MPRERVNNERKACDAVARAIEKLAGVLRTSDRSPEDNREASPIEYVAVFDGITYAFEHTLVEAFDGQIQADQEFSDFIEPIIQAIEHHIPPVGFYKLYFTLHPSRGIKASQLAHVRSKITDWVVENALGLHSECSTQPEKNVRPHGHSGERRGSVAGVELRLFRETGWWMSDRANGKIAVARFAPENYENLRRGRLNRAATKKLPKLKCWKESGARTVLILENSDLSLSNHVVILEALEAALENRDDAPDEVWLVDTTIETEWTALCLKRDGFSLPDDDTLDRFHEFDPCCLSVVPSS